MQPQDRFDMSRKDFARLRRAVRALPPDTRRLFVLSELEGFSREVIAERMNLPIEQVTASLQTARRLFACAY
jgi:DNA-directed RNA polymerase specialized sigma24 family protein